jgi:hypothetical protein
MHTQLILGVELGIGKTKCVLLAQRDGFSTPTNNAFLSTTTAIPMIRMASALHAIRAMV